MTFEGVREGIRMLMRARRVRKEGFRKYNGSPEKICRTIIESGFKKHGFFPVSTGHFSEFYARDFSWIAESLVRLGYAEEVRTTLEYAMKRYMKAGKVTTMITPRGEAYDFPGPGPDSLAMFLYAIIATGNDTLAAENRQFLNQECDRFIELFVDQETWLPRKGTFTSIRDHAQRRQSCYDATMIALVARSAERLGLSFPKAADELRDILIENYWNGTYFFSDTHKQGIVIADANLFPFWTGVVHDKKMEKRAITAMQAAGLDSPFPLRYVSSNDKERERVGWHLASLFAQDYETDSIWMHMGPLYLMLLAGHDRKRATQLCRKYTKILLTYRTYLEIFDAKGEPYATPWYMTDEGMLWCAAYLDVAQRLGAITPS